MKDILGEAEFLFLSPELGAKNIDVYAYLH